MSGVGKQFEQLPMFMTAKELKNEVTPDDWRAGGPSLDSLWRRKAREAEKSGLTESIRKDGVQEPVEVVHRGETHRYLVDGHHRVAAASKVGPKTLLPVRHSEGPWL